jgi:hypothetical protein
MLAAFVIRAMTTRRNNPKNNHLHTRRRANVKSHPISKLLSLFMYKWRHYERNVFVNSPLTVPHERHLLQLLGYFITIGSRVSQHFHVSLFHGVKQCPVCVGGCSGGLGEEDGLYIGLERELHSPTHQCHFQCVPDRQTHALLPSLQFPVLYWNIAIVA